MNKGEIWEVLQTCLLASDGADMTYLEEKGFNRTLSKVGLQLYVYLKSKNLEVMNEEM